jgi:hypothetical protein
VDRSRIMAVMQGGVVKAGRLLSHRSQVLAAGAF